MEEKILKLIKEYEKEVYRDKNKRDNDYNYKHNGYWDTLISTKEDIIKKLKQIV